MRERERVEEWERHRYGRMTKWRPDLGPLPVWRVVSQGPGEVVDMPERSIAA